MPQNLSSTVSAISNVMVQDTVGFFDVDFFNSFSIDRKRSNATGIISTSAGNTTWESLHGTLLYKNAPPLSASKLDTTGAFGTIYRVKYAFDPTMPDSFTVILKIQECNVDTLKSMTVAATLRECGIVQFVYFYVSPIASNPSEKVIWTVMDDVGTDVAKFIANSSFRAQRQSLQDQFGTFLATTLNCLMDHKGTYADMKPSNIGIRETRGTWRFCLLDIDSINGHVSSFPLGIDAQFIEDIFSKETQRDATIFSFGVTAALFAYTGQPAIPLGFTNWLTWKQFHWKKLRDRKLESLAVNRRKALVDMVAECTSMSIKSLIKGAIDVLDKYFPPLLFSGNYPEISPAVRDYESELRDQQMAVAQLKQEMDALKVSTTKKEAEFFDHTQELERKIRDLEEELGRRPPPPPSPAGPGKKRP